MHASVLSPKNHQSAWRYNLQITWHQLPLDEAMSEDGEKLQIGLGDARFDGRRRDTRLGDAGRDPGRAGR